MFFQGSFLIVFARQNRIFKAQVLSSRAPLSQPLFYVSFIQPFSFKRRKKRNLSTQSELLLNLYLSLACHVNYKQTPFKRILKSNSKTPSDTHWFLKWTSFLYSSEFGIIPTSK